MDHNATTGHAAKHAADRPKKRAKDISAAEFRTALREAGFSFLQPSGHLVDTRHRGARRFILPVTGDRGRILRRETLSALKASRSAFEAELAARAEQVRAQIALAEKLAPQALPSDRSSLEGPAAIHQMAEDFRTMATRGLGVTAGDLRVVGWSREQINEHAEAARQLGYARENGAVA